MADAINSSGNGLAAGFPSRPFGSFRERDEHVEPGKRVEMCLLRTAVALRQKVVVGRDLLVQSSR